MPGRGSPTLLSTDSRASQQPSAESGPCKLQAPLLEQRVPSYSPDSPVAMFGVQIPLFEMWISYSRSVPCLWNTQLCLTCQSLSQSVKVQITFLEQERDWEYLKSISSRLILENKTNEAWFFFKLKTKQNKKQLPLPPPENSVIFFFHYNLEYIC